MAALISYTPGANGDVDWKTLGTLLTADVLGQVSTRW